MLKLIFPPKGPDAAVSEYVAYCAKLVLGIGIVCLLWSGFELVQWARSYSFSTVTARLERGDEAWLQRGAMQGINVAYTVNGVEYRTDRLAYGGRPFGAISLPEAPTVYYDPSNPAHAVIWRRPNEAVIMALLIGLAAPFLARWLWVEYA